MDEHESAIVAQTTITFPLLDDKDPVLQQADGRQYISPMLAICHALGAGFNVHIRLWWQEWGAACKLPCPCSSNPFRR